MLHNLTVKYLFSLYVVFENTSVQYTQHRLFEDDGALCVLSVGEFGAGFEESVFQQVVL
jgi:hypothetical protein